MARLEDLTQGAAMQDIVPGEVVTVVSAQWQGTSAVDLTYRMAGGKPGSELIYRDREPEIELAKRDQPWSFDGSGRLFRLARNGDTQTRLESISIVLHSRDSTLPEER